MKEKHIATLTWGQHHSLEGLYGSEVSILQSGDTRLVNSYMPSGTVIQRWYSSTDFQATRATPTLPLLYPGVTYRLAVLMSSVPDSTCIFEVQFFGRISQRIGRKFLHSPAECFVYPQSCYFYTIQMINAGCDELTFKSMDILEVDSRGD